MTERRPEASSPKIFRSGLVKALKIGVSNIHAFLKDVHISARILANCNDQFNPFHRGTARNTTRFFKF